MIHIICGYTGVSGTLLRWCIAFIQSCTVSIGESIGVTWSSWPAVHGLRSTERSRLLNLALVLFVSDFACGQETVV